MEDRARGTAPRPAVAAALWVLMAAAVTLTCDGAGTDPVEEPNQPPQPVGVIPPVDVFVGDSASVEAKGHFRDPDGDSLAYSAMSPDAGVVAVSVVGDAVVLRGVSQGAATVTVTATDPGGLSAVQTFAVAVPNRGPEAIGEIRDIEVGVGDSVAIGLPGHFTDPDGDGLVFAASSSDTSVAGVAVARDTVEVAARAKGAATITVTARDAGGLEAQHTFEVTVPNRAPVVLETLPDGRLVVGDTARTDLSLHFSDPDADSLSFAAASSAAHVATATVSGTTLTIAALAADTATITVTATDPDGLAATQAFTVVVPNRAPEALGAIPDTTVTVGDTILLVASRHFRDPDGDSLGYTVRTSRRIRVAATVADSTVTLAAMSAGSSNITLTARDPGGLSATQRLRVVVEPVRLPDLVVNDPMVDPDSVAVGSDFTLRAAVRNQGDGDATSSTTLRFFHSDNPRITPTDSLLGTFPVRPLNTAERSVGSFIAQAPTDPGTYYYGACVGALDNESNAGNNCSGAVRVRVWQPNRAPQPVGTIPLIQVVAQGDSVSLNVAPYFDDPDEDTLTYAATSSAPSIATAFAADSTVTVSGVAAGRATIAVTARDPDGLTATQRVQVTVEPPRPPDLVVESPAVDADSIAPGATFNLSAVVRNQGDGDAPSPTTLRFFLSNDPGITTDDALVDTFPVPQLDAGATSPATLAVTGPTDPGTYFYGACAVPLENESDTRNNCSAGVQLRVWQPNRRPRAVGTIRARPVRAGASISLDVASYFDDPDGDTLTYAATSSAPSIATASAAGSAVTVSGVAAGGATITVTAHDPDGLTAAQSFEVTVQAAPSPDLVVQFSASANSVAPGDGFTLNATVRNQGSGASSSTTLRYYRSGDARISTADELLGTAAVGRVEPSRTSSESLDLTAPSIGGTYYYGACVDALANESDRSNNCSDAFAVRVSQVNREPQAFGVIPDRAVIVGGSVGVEVADNFTDPDGDALSYSAVSSDSLTAKATAVNSTVTVTGVRVGGATINVTATDPDGLTATQSFTISVEEETTPLPDLVVESPSVDVADSIEVGARFALSADVRNRGPGEAAATTLRYYRSADATITTLDTEVGTDGVSRLATGESSGATITLDAPADVGTYYFGACVDAVGNESIVGNNCSGAVELRVWRRNRPPRAVGRITDGSVTVGNSISLDVAPYFSDPDGDDLRYSVGSSAPDKARATNFGSSVTVTGVAQGSATITVTARDPGGLPATQAFDVNVTVAAQPDLVVQSTTASVDSVALSTAFTLTAVVRNQGSGALSSTTRLRFYRSLDATIRTADTEIGNSSVGLLAASRSITREITPTSPATGGTYYYGACVDAVADESDAGNNCSGAVEVWVGDLNRPPQARGTIGDKAVELSDQDSVDPASYFTDPDMDQLRYSAASSRPDTVSVEVYNDEVQFKGQALGRSTITVTARDPGGLTATQSFRVTVADIPNRAPQVRNRLNDITDAEVGDSYHIQVSIVFTDPDGDDLTYTTTNTDTTVATVQLRNDSIFVAALAPGSTTMSITATDPGGLSATDSWDVTVVVAVPATFDIELGFTSFVTEAQKEHIRAARDSWASILAATELRDIAFNQEIDCLGLTTTVGTVDDHLVLVDITDIDGVSGTLARATYCYRRAIGGFPVGPIVSAIQFDAADIERVRAWGSLAGLAFHEMAHGLGFIDGYWEDRGVLDDDDTDPHFTGGLAVAAFNAAGGTTYTGNKVPISSDHSHWKGDVFGQEVMTPTLRVGTAPAVSAITILAMADIGYSVDASLADDYDLPGSIAPGAIAGEPGDILDLRNDVVRGPVVVVGPDGRTIRVIPPPPGSMQFPRGPAREAHIEIRPPRVILSNPGSLRPPATQRTFWRRDRAPAFRPGPP